MITNFSLQGSTQRNIILPSPVGQGSPGCDVAAEERSVRAGGQLQENDSPEKNT